MALDLDTYCFFQESKIWAHGHVFNIFWSFYLLIWGRGRTPPIHCWLAWCLQWLDWAGPTAAARGSVQGSHTGLSLHLLPPAGDMSRKLESKAEPVLKSRHSSRDVDIPAGVLTARPNICAACGPVWWTSKCPCHRSNLWYSLLGVHLAVDRRLDGPPLLEERKGPR